MAQARDTGPWHDTSSADALQLVAEGVATFSGFGVACILLVRGQETECVAIAGSEAGRERLLGTRDPLSFLHGLIDVSEDWGALRFIPHERLSDEVAAVGIVPETAASDDPDAWHPRDALVLPVYDDSDRLRGALLVDEPHDGRHPGPDQRRRLENYAVHARRAVLATLEREELAERIAVAGAARRVVRAAGGALSLATVLERSKIALLEGFGADELWWRLRGVPDSLTPPLSAHEGVDPPGLDLQVPMIAEAIALDAWEKQTVVVLRSGLPLVGAATADSGLQAVAEAFLARPDIGSLMVIPLGAGEECLGTVVLHRRDGSEWTPVEASEALDIGHDLGRAVLNARSFEREQALVARLRAVDAYKNQLISTVSHELRTPLTSVVGNLELMKDLIDEDTLSPDVTRAVAATGRGARRLVHLVEDLLLLSRVADPDAAAPRQPVDLGDVIADAVALSSAEARSREVELVVASRSTRVVVPGDPSDLDRVVVNIVSNAVKYSPPGAVVRLWVEDHGHEAVVVCSDQGYGISEADQVDLFREFFRSEDPSIRRMSGTGLGLAIAHRVVQHHGGRIGLDSTLGLGTTFRVHLPSGEDTEVTQRARAHPSARGGARSAG